MMVRMIIGIIAATTSAATPASAVRRESPAVDLLPAKPGTVSAQGAPLQLKFSLRDVVTVRSYSFLPKEGAAQTLNADWCGVVIEAAGKPPQAVVIFGTGSTWYGDCRRLRAIGTMPAAGSSVRFAVINDVSSPSATTRGVAFITRDAGRWKLDDKLGASPRFDDVPKTIPALRKVLRHHRLDQ